MHQKNVRAPRGRTLASVLMTACLAGGAATPAGADRYRGGEPHGWKVDGRRPGSFVAGSTAILSIHRSRVDVSFREDRSPPELETILFDLDRDELRPEYRDDVDRLGETLALNPEFTVEIQGHADDTGTEAYNEDLSRRRARTVYSRIVAYGETEPAVTNDTAADRARNRRVEFILFSRRP
jgi:outer membrane protein OmpA-like peptidoglycan-associated protein